MQLGFNFTLGATYEMVQRLIREGHVDYCELLIDNFLQVPPQELADAIDCPVGFHIMFSKFLENDQEFLESMAKRLRTYIDVLQPIYVSDHLVRFYHNDRQLYHLAELDYDKEYDTILPRVKWWQEQLGEKLYLENYPSIMDSGLEAPAFFQRLAEESGCGVLFDASNAVCAQRNCGVSLAEWESVIRSTSHFHVGGYSQSILEPKITLDTHANLLAVDTLAFLEDYREVFDKPEATITYERDENIEYDSIVEDLTSLRRLFNSTEERRYESSTA